MLPSDAFDADSDHAELSTRALKGFEAAIEMLAIMRGHVAGAQQGVPDRKSVV